MTKEGYQEFIKFTQHLYANRDHYSRGKIIEDLRDKVTELEQSSSPEANNTFICHDADTMGEGAKCDKMCVECRIFNN